MRIKTTIRDQSVEMATVIPAGEWRTVYVVYTFTTGGYGISKVYIDGADAGGSAWTSSSTSPPSFSNSDLIKIGGGFKGHLRRFQIYTPAASPFETASGFNSCNPTACSIDMGFSDPRTCLKAVCTTPGTYSSYGTCERN